MTKSRGGFRKALRIDPQLRSAQLNLALLSRKGEDLGAAARQIENQLSNCSGDSCADLSFQLSIIYYHQKLFSKAAQIISKVKEEDKDERIYRHLAIYYRENQEYDKAIAALETAAKRLVLEPQTEYELAETCLMAGYYKKASGYYLALIPKWKQNPWRLYYQLGYSFMEAYELDKAEEYFKKSIKSKENVGARGLLAFVYNRKGNSAEARKLWEKISRMILRIRCSG
jgi:tetratricopeptide (TPR) repeat protein